MIFLVYFKMILKLIVKFLTTVSLVGFNCFYLIHSTGAITVKTTTIGLNRSLSSPLLNTIKDSPVIGILSLPSWNGKLQSEEQRSSYIPASYVKFLESAGARVMPVLSGRDESYYHEMVNLTNGMLFTGGGLSLNTSIYTKSAKFIWDEALRLNRSGDYYPIWGTCLGFELIAYLANNLTWPLTSCSSWDKPSNVNFSSNSDQLRISTRMFKDADEKIIQILSRENVTINYHRQCLVPETVRNSELNKFFTIISTNKDKNGLEFVSIMESQSAPIFGVQFHPERVLFEPVSVSSYRRTPHSPNAILVSQYFANFFVNEARKNRHTIPMTSDYLAKLIYNYCPRYTGLDGKTSHEQVYYFSW